MKHLFLSCSAGLLLLPVFLLGLGAGLALGGCAGRETLSEGDLKVKLLKRQSRNEGSAAATELPLWFVRPQGDSLVFEKVLRPYKGPSTAIDRLDFAVRELAEGPHGDEAAQGLASELPRGTVLIDVRKKNGGELIVNLSRSFVQGGGIDSFDTRMEQLRRTVASVAGKAKVYLYIEGERLDRTVGEGLEIKQPIN
ncbi:MAG: GerMN domain-containing protein [Candidatus Obscuribacter phosphatis]|uniref:GerMN domain-containing protein n=1 Tax=Candidatus Obscuribacter phosphatis TaxID=1906157 RepID=A0A8J7TKY1_9BACT|nr:GerMN domain-containing protein [Candidatus Obscuribacter phosphatis]